MKHTKIILISLLSFWANVVVEAQPKKDVCIQLYSVRDVINAGNDLSQILNDLAKMGYTSVEAANYNDGQFYGLSPIEFKQLVEQSGMKVLSSHCGRGLSNEELVSGDLTKSLVWWDQCIAAHKAAGMSYIVTPYQELPSTIKDLKTYCDYYNEIGRKCNAVGIKYGYHNHAHEFKKVEDSAVMLDYMLENTDPENVFYQMDVYWVVRGQQSPVDYFNRYPGRFTVLHIKDDKEIGQSGMVGFDAIFKNVQTAGVKDIVAEIEKYSNDDVMGSVKSSLDYLQNAEFVPFSY